MKKILVFAAAMASMLFAASCQKENFSSAEQGGDVVTATFTIQAPGLPGTKAATSADQTMVGDGRAADNLVFAVFDEEGVELTDLRQGDWVNQIGDNQNVIKFDNSENPQTTVTVKLVRGKEYSFVCWAQNEAATCYDFSDMKNIGISYADYNAANNDLRDAFYAYAETDGVVTENFSQSITLARPFAQVNVGTTDFVEAQKAGLEIDNLYSTVTVKNAATSLETFTGKASNPVAATFAYAHAVATEYDLVINKNLVQNNPQVEIADKYGWLAMNYILVADGSENGEGSALAEVSFEVREGDDVVLTSYDVPNVPVQRNFRTNIVGSLLIAEGTISIIIDPIFNGEYVVDVWDGLSTVAPAADEDGYYVTTAAELAWVADQVNNNAKTFENETVYLAADVDLAGQMWTPIGAGATPFKGTFEVLPNTSLLTKSTTEYYAIHGLNVDFAEGPAGLFGWINGTVKNVTLVNPQVKGASHVAAVVGKIFNSGLVEGCTVKGGSVYGNHYVGGVVAYAYGSVKNNVVNGVAVTGVSVDEDLDGDKVGGVLGFHPGDAKAEVSGNQVLAVTVAAKRDAGAVVGAANADNVKNNHVETATVGSTEALIEKNAGVVVGRVLAGTLNPKANTYNHEQITVNGVQAEPAVIEFTAEAASEEVLPVEGGKYVINVTSNVVWAVTADDVLTVEPAQGEGNAQIVVTVPANELYEAVSYQVTVATEEEADVKEFTFTINQVAAEPEYEKVTVAEFMNKKEGKYELTGVITKIYQAYNSQYKNIAFYLNDGSVEGDGVIVYRMSCDGIEDPANTIVPGCTITVQGACSIYNNVAQMGAGCVCVAYEPFVAKESEWGVVGDLNTWGESKDIVMYNTWHTENLFVAYDVDITSGAIKVRANNTWNDAKNYGLEVAGNIYADKYYSVITGSGSQNATPMAYGTYDVYFDLTNKRIALMTPGKAYAEAVDGGKPVVVVAGLKDHEWGLVGSFNDWNVTNYVVAEVDGDWAVAKNVTLENNAEFKFAADKAWTLSYGTGSNVNVGTVYTTYNNGGNMKFVGEAGAYDVYFSLVDASFYMTEAVVNVVGGTDDFATITATNTNYVSGKTTAGWNYKNCAIFKGGTSDSSPAFKMIGDASNRALCMNGKTSGVGSITSPTFTTGCGTLKFNYGLPFGDTKMKFRVDIMQDGAVVHTFTINNASATKLTAYSHEETVNVSGDFQIVFTNLSPSNSTSNKDRTAIWDVEWTGCN